MISERPTPSGPHMKLGNFVVAQDSTNSDENAVNVNDQLVQAANSNDSQAILDALHNGANINFQEQGSGQTVLMSSTLRGLDESVRTLLKNGADPSITEKDGYGPPHGAGFQGRAEVMRILHEEFNIDVLKDEHPDGYLPFHRACWGRAPRHTDTVRYLLELGIDFNTPAKNGRTCWEMTSNPGTKALLEEYGAVGSADSEFEL